jgi:hypothetical protein
LLFFVSSVFRLRNSGNMETWRHRNRTVEKRRHGDLETWAHGHGDIKLKRKTLRFSLLRLPFARHANRSSSFVCLCLLMKKQTKVIHLKMD